MTTLFSRMRHTCPGCGQPCTWRRAHLYDSAAGYHLRVSGCCYLPLPGSYRLVRSEDEAS